jgi:Nineteen complex-related protein 2
MKKSFAGRRAPRKIGEGDGAAPEEEINGKHPKYPWKSCLTGASNRLADLSSTSIEPVVKRPQLLAKGKRKSTPRISFGPSAQDDEDEGSTVVKAKKIGASRLSAVQQSESSGRSSPGGGLPFRAGLESDRPSYTKEALRELQQSTPNTKDRQSEDAGDFMALDVASKFGSVARIGGESAIPTEAEIREKKERRARRAKEQEYIALYGDEDPYDENDQRELMLRPEEKYPETRLVHEDEDLAEGFDDFVEDGNIALGRKAEREEKRRKRAEISNLIDDAQVLKSDEDEDDSEVERKAAYDAAQFRAGTYGQNVTGTNDRDEDQRPQAPSKITPIPELSSVLTQLRDALEGMQETSKRYESRLREIVVEKAEVAEQEQWVQTQLKETGEKYEKLRAEAGFVADSGVDGTAQNGNIAIQRGLESFGTPLDTPQDSDDSDE